jgi:hypothetical protein
VQKLFESPSFAEAAVNVGSPKISLGPRRDKKKMREKERSRKSGRKKRPLGHVNRICIAGVSLG